MPLCHLLSCAQTWSTSKEHIHLPPLHNLIKPYTPFPESPRNLLLLLPSCFPLLPVVHFLFFCRLNQTDLIFIGASEAVHRTVWLRGKINAAPKWEIKLNMLGFGLSRSVFINIYRSYIKKTTRIHYWYLAAKVASPWEFQRWKTTSHNWVFFSILYLFQFPSSEMSLQKQPDQGVLLCWKNVSQLQ